MLPSSSPLDDGPLARFLRKRHLLDGALISVKVAKISGGEAARQWPASAKEQLGIGRLLVAYAPIPGIRLGLLQIEDEVDFCLVVRRGVDLRGKRLGVGPRRRGRKSRHRDTNNYRV